MPMIFDDGWTEELADRGLGRRDLVRLGAGGFVLAASGLLLPAAAGETEARNGALGGTLGGRHGKKARKHKHKRRNKDRDKGKPASRGLFRSTALSIRTSAPAEFQLTFTATYYYRLKAGLGEYGPWQVAREANPASDRYAADHYRVGVLLKPQWPEAPGMNLFVDVYNQSFDYPRGAVYWGYGLQPDTCCYPQPLIVEQDFGQGESPSGTTIINTRPPFPTRYADCTLKRAGDSRDYIEFQFFVNVR